jgi:cytochrome c-type biogenesis protein CcmH/NrfG
VAELSEKTGVSRLRGNAAFGTALECRYRTREWPFPDRAAMLRAEGRGTMSPRSIAALIALALQLLQLGACAASKSSNAAIEEMERRHEEDMTRMGGGSM